MGLGHTRQRRDILPGGTGGSGLRPSGGEGHRPTGWDGRVTSRQGGIGRRPSGPADRSGPSSAWPSGGFLDSETIKTRRQILVCQIIA